MVKIVKIVQCMKTLNKFYGINVNMKCAVLGCEYV